MPVILGWSESTMAFIVYETGGTQDALNMVIILKSVCAGRHLIL